MAVAAEDGGCDYVPVPEEVGGDFTYVLYKRRRDGGALSLAGCTKKHASRSPCVFEAGPPTWQFRCITHDCGKWAGDEEEETWEDVERGEEEEEKVSVCSGGSDSEGEGGVEGQKSEVEFSLKILKCPGAKVKPFIVRDFVPEESDPFGAKWCSGFYESPCEACDHGDFERCYTFNCKNYKGALVVYRELKQDLGTLCSNLGTDLNLENERFAGFGRFKGLYKVEFEVWGPCCHREAVHSMVVDVYRTKREHCNTSLGALKRLRRKRPCPQRYVPGAGLSFPWGRNPWERK